VGGDNLITVKDFAFEATPDTAISAGDQGSLGVADSAFGAFEYHTSDNALHLSSATMMDQVVLHNVLGQEVARQQINASSATVAMDRLSAGVYIATISAEGQTKSIKISKR
jgi:predicted alternative tryptophan synthase beta-subunit